MSYFLDCEYCGVRFEAKRPHARFHNDECRKANHDREHGSSSEAGGERVLGSLKQPTDTARLLTALRARGPVGIHSHEIRRLGISGNPSQRVKELEEDGHQIEHRREHKGRRPGVRYRLLADAGAEPISEAA